MSPDRFHNLLSAFYEGKLSNEEAKDLAYLLHDPTQKELLESSFQSSVLDNPSIDAPITLAFVYRQIQVRYNLGGAVKIAPSTHRIHFLKTAWFRYAAAIILLLGIGGYLLWRESSEIPTFRENDKGSVVQSGVSSNNKAILTLADGSQIILDDKASGNIAQQGGTQIIKLDGNQLTYNGNPKKTSPPAREGTVFDPREAGQKPGVGALYNTITTPRGSQYQVILPDGTKTWLNAASSIKFPTTFTGNQRKVETTGEIYFEVAVNKMQPFVVTTKNMEVQVLGTSFNINAYENEPILKTTLVEGSIKVTPPQGLERVLKPGQAYANGKVMEADIEQEIAWKNGLFNFKNADLPTVMRQLERWYDIEVKYESTIPVFDFQGKLQRNLSLSQILKILDDMNISYRMKGRTLIIK